MKTRYIDLQYLNEISGGKKELLIEMIEIFNSEVPGYVKLMDEYCKIQNWMALGKLCHKAKASASIMGMKQLCDELKNLELLTIEEKDTQLYPSYIRSIDIHFNNAREELNQFAKTL